jgi:hypothetical protein
MKIRKLKLQLESLTGKKVILEKDKNFIHWKVNKFLSGKMTTMEAFEFLRHVYDIGSQDIKNQLEEKGVEWGSGDLEKSMEKFGYKFSPSDIQSLSLDDVSSLIYNIFYNNTGGLLKLVDSNALKALTNRALAAAKYHNLNIEEEYNFKQPNRLPDYIKFRADIGLPPLKPSGVRRKL